MITTASTKDKLDRLLSLPAGATHVANYKTENFVDVVMDATGGKGVDIVVDTVGQSHFTRNVDALAMDGRLILLSMISGSFFNTLSFANSLTPSILLHSSRSHGLGVKSSTNPSKAPVHPGFDSAVAVKRL